MAAVILLEPLGIGQILGGAIILAGITLTQAGDDLKKLIQTRWFSAGPLANYQPMPDSNYSGLIQA
jgi:hypothetical protein